MQFRINIKLGNSEMQTPDDVADAVHNVVITLEDVSLWSSLSDSSHTIWDVNGHRVGEWLLVEEGDE